MNGIITNKLVRFSKSILVCCILAFFLQFANWLYYDEREEREGICYLVSSSNLSLFSLALSRSLSLISFRGKVRTSLLLFLFIVLLLFTVQFTIYEFEFDLRRIFGVKVRCGGEFLLLAITPQEKPLYRLHYSSLSIAAEALVIQ